MVRNVLEAIGVAEHAVRNEEREMADVAIGRTASKRVLGSMNDFAWMIEGYLEGTTSLLDASLRLAETPCSPLEMDTPRRTTVALFLAKPHVTITSRPFGVSTPPDTTRSSSRRSEAPGTVRVR
jgi:hypothetical protein